MHTMGIPIRITENEQFSHISSGSISVFFIFILCFSFPHYVRLDGAREHNDRHVKPNEAATERTVKPFSSFHSASIKTSPNVFDLLLSHHRYKAAIKQTNKIYVLALAYDFCPNGNIFIHFICRPIEMCDWCASYYYCPTPFVSSRFSSAGFWSGSFP